MSKLAGTGIQTEVGFRDEEEKLDYAHIHNWLHGEMPRLAECCARTPHMAELMTDVATMTERYTDLHEIDPRTLSPYVVCTPKGQIIIDLHGSVSCDASGVIQRRFEREMTNGATATVPDQKIIPNGDRVVVAVLKPKEKSIGGVLLPQTAKDPPQEGVIVMVGDGPNVKKFTIGENVIFSKFSGAEMTLDGQQYLILAENHVIARVRRDREDS